MEELIILMKELKACAKPLGKYEDYDITDLANKLCEAMDNNDERNKNIYYSALILRFWYLISKSYNANRTLKLEIMDFFDGLSDTILRVCNPEDRAWQKDTKLNAKQVINQSFNTRFIAQKYYEANLQKNLGKLNTCSLSEPITNEEEEMTLGDLIEDTNVDFHDEAAHSIIQDYINKNKVIEAIILDNIAYKDVFKHEKEIKKISDTDGNEIKYTEHSTEFWSSKLIKELNHLDANYVRYFIHTYKIDLSIFEVAMKTILTAKNTKLYKMLANSLNDLRAMKYEL